MNLCQEFFQRPREKKKLCSDLRELPHDLILSWETLTASIVSPGPIRSDELLYRQMVDPVHWNSQKHEFTPGAFSDVETLGMSVNRFAHTNFSALAKSAKERVDKHNQERPDAPREFLGFVIYCCSALRKEAFQADASQPEVRLFAVFDTALASDLSHADICRLGCGANDRYHKSRAKAVLWELGMKWLVTRYGEHVPNNQFPG